MTNGILLNLLVAFFLFSVVHSKGGSGGGGRGSSAARGSVGGGRGSTSGRGGGRAYYVYSGTGYYGDKSAVRATSMSGYYGGLTTVNVLYFRGSGSGTESEEPLVNSSLIYNSIFHKDAFSSIFTPWTGDAPVFQPQINPWNFSVSTQEFLKIPLKIADASRPMTIDNSSLYYFWSNSSLPSNHNFSGCYRYKTMNDLKEISLCNVTKMDRCAANISDLPHFSPFNFYKENGEIITQFSWLCKEGQVCCAWECCDPVDHSTATIQFVVIVAAALGSLFALCACCYWIDNWMRRREKQRYLSSVARCSPRNNPQFQSQNIVPVEVVVVRVRQEEELEEGVDQYRSAVEEAHRVDSVALVMKATTETTADTPIDEGSRSEPVKRLVNSSVIYNSIFHKEAFSSIFAKWTGEAPDFQPQTNKWNLSLSKLKFMKIPLKVANLSGPVTIHGSLYYFWGDDSLPSKIYTHKCYQYKTMNDFKEISLCDVAKMDRCAANILDLPHFSPFNFYNSRNGQLITQFSWLCKEGQKCCDQECCDVENDWKAIVVTFSVSGGFVIFVVAVGCYIHWHDKRKRGN